MVQERNNAYYINSTWMLSTSSLNINQTFYWKQNSSSCSTNSACFLINCFRNSITWGMTHTRISRVRISLGKWLDQGKNFHCLCVLKKHFIILHYQLTWIFNFWWTNANSFIISHVIHYKHVKWCLILTNSQTLFREIKKTSLNSFVPIFVLRSFHTTKT